MLSDDKVSHISHVVLKALKERDIIDIKDDEGAVRRTIKKAIQSELRIGQEMEEAVHKKINSFARRPVEGSPEWEIQYNKFMREEEIKRGRAVD